MPKIIYNDKDYSAGGGADIEIDTELSEVSENPIQNKVVTEALKSKVSSDTLDDYQKIPEIDVGHLLNEQTDVQCDQTYNDHVEVYLDLKATGENGQLIVPTASVGFDLVGATENYAGVLTAADKVKLNGIEAEANKYTLPTAGTNSLGGVKTTSTVTSTTGLTAAPIINGNVYYKDTTYSTATTSTSGLMSADDKIKLNNLTGMTYKSGQVPPSSSSGVISLEAGCYYIISLNTANPPHSLWLVDNVCNHAPYGGVTRLAGYESVPKVRTTNPNDDNTYGGVVIEGCDHSPTSYKIYKLPF